jgi:uncharacterized membrane protein
MDVLGQFHPQIVHTPVALLIFSALFAIAGRLFDRQWVRKASVLLLVFGFLGSFAAVRSGVIAHRVPEKEQGVSEEEIDEHGQMGERTMYLAGGALVAVVAASRLTGQAAAAVGGLALVLQILAAVAVGFTGHAGGELVYEYGANVRVGGQLVKNPGASRELPGGSGADTLGAAAADHEEQAEQERHEVH